MEYIWHACGSLFIFPNSLSYSTFLEKQRIQNGTNFEQGKSIVQGTRQREKTMTGAKSSFKIIYEKNGQFWLVAIQRAHFWWKVPPPSAIKSETIEKENEGVREPSWWLQHWAKMDVLYLGCISVGIYCWYTTEVNNSAAIE